MALNQEQAAYFEALEAMFASTGWHLFKEAFQGFQDALTASAFSLTSEGYMIAKGRNDAFRQVLEYQNLIETLKQAQEEAED